MLPGHMRDIGVGLEQLVPIQHAAKSLFSIVKEDELVDDGHKITAMPCAGAMPAAGRHVIFLQARL